MTLLSELSENIETLVRETAPSVVAVEHARGQGSGIIVANDGYVVTNSHVVRGARELRAQVDAGERVRAELVGDDPASDLAVLRLSRAGFKALSLFEGRRVSVGQLVLAVGNPFRFERSVSLGVVSAIDRHLPAPRGPLGSQNGFEGLVQTDAAINPGSSGGPLLDATGAVVGVNTAIIPHARGLGFAIPAHTVNWVLGVLLKHGRIVRPRLGVAARGFELTRERALELGQTRAVRVLGVTAGEPAERDGLKVGDLVLRANDREVGSVDDLVRTMVLSEGKALDLTLLRGGERLSLTLRPRFERRAA